MADRNPYKYIGLYEGSSGSSNGSLSKKVRNNISITSHIPSIRTIISLRVESTLYSFRRMLSESAYDNRSYVLDSKSDYLPSASSADIYKGDKFVAVYPLYYVSIDDMDTRIPFKDALIRAKENDQALFNELTKMIVKTNTTYYFKPNVISAYFSANLNVTKELGDHISISFLANNFLNNMAKVKNRQNGNQSTLYNSSYIPDFYYGMTLRVKI